MAGRPRATPTRREAKLVEFIHELFAAYEEQREWAAAKHDLLHRTMALADVAIAKWTRRAKGEKELSKVNALRRQLKEMRQDAERPEIEARVMAGKSYQQIADARGWSKSSVGRAVKRWSTPTRKIRPRQ